ncbi:MAG: hypothetical protein LBN18_07080 [Dysgonamonadaceae bacterium]|jgi:hypothetical protein|nr:hypothetical protein [Dysgonamonadaceae bacterium]
MKRIINSLLIAGLSFLCFTSIQAQPGTWKTYTAYQNATLTAATSNYIFAVYDGALLSYSPSDKEVKTYSFDDGLNDVKIVQMAYCPNAKALVLVYENSNIDLFYGQNNVVNISAIKQDTKYTNKTIDGISIEGNYAYLSAGFGIVKLDVVRREIKDTWPGPPTMAACRWGNYFYAATNEGLKRASETVNLLDQSNWQKVTLNNFTGNETKITQMLVFKDNLIFYDKSKVYYMTKEGSIHLLFDGSLRSMTVLNDQLVLCVYSLLFFYTDVTQPNKAVRVTANSISSYNSSNTYWIAQPEAGLAEIKREANSTEYTVLTSGIQINSPARNYMFYLTYTANKLLVVGGGRAADRDNKPGTLMILENGKWTNFNDARIAQAAGLSWVRDFTSVAVDPRNPKHYFVASYGEGVYEFNDTTFVNRYTIGNSSLQSALPTNPNADHFVRVDGLVYDKNNNLYMVNAGVPNSISTYTASNTWKSFYNTKIISCVPNLLIVTKDNWKWGNIYREKPGVFAFDDSSAEVRLYYNNRFIDQQGNDIGASMYYCIVEDPGNGSIWVGTDNGPVSFAPAGNKSIETMLDEGVCNRIILTDQEGSGYYLMAGQRVKTIAVDGAGRKWLGSENGGVFMVDDSDRSNVIVENFTTDNSQLISNNIVSIAINNESGEIFIGTDKGLVSYMSDAVQGSSDFSNVYAFPNPVKPGNRNQVTITGLMSNSTVRITDMGGNLISQGSSRGGQYVWNCADLNGNIVKAGIYLVLAATPDGAQGVATKIMVIN